MNDLPEPQPNPPEEAQPPEEQPSTVEIGLRHILVFSGLSLIYILMWIAGGELTNVAIAGLEVIPFTILAVLAYAAHAHGGWRKRLTVGYWILLMGATALTALLFTFAAIMLPSLEGVSFVEGTAMRMPLPPFEQFLRIGSAFLALMAAGALSLSCFLPKVREKAARFVGIDAQSFVHATALATAVAMTLICLVPLLAVNEPPLLPLVQLEGMADMQDSDAQLRTTLYSLIWAVPASFLAVGYPRRRTFREARERLSLVRPSLRQVVLAVLIVAGLLLVMDYLSEGIELVWNERGWRTTDAEAIELLFGFVVGPVGAVITSIVAGLGEELVFRGVLQPRLGIFLPALMFTSVHAFQYDFDALVQVLFLGVILGYIRKRTNTTTSAIVHGGYDLALFLEVVS